MLARRTTTAMAVLAFFACTTTGVHAQKAAPEGLKVVKNGVFTLKVGESVDVTDRGVLLSLRRISTDSSDNVRGVIFTINGSGGSYSVGVRRNLKTERSTRGIFKDLSSCTVDLVSAAAPKGAPASATFRLACP